MIEVMFVAGLAGVLFGVLAWGVKTLPSERWQMIAAVPLTKQGNGEWQGLNLTYYGFFSATASTFGVAMTIVLLASVATPVLVVVAVIAVMLAICVPASKVLAWVIESKRNTFTIAGAAFLASLLLPPGLLLAQRVLPVRFARDLVRNQHKDGVRSRYSTGFGQPVVETDVKVRSLLARAVEV